LVLAFSFSNASGRLDASRLTILDEVNAIDTVWNRIDLAEPEVRPRLREVVRLYLDTRIRAYEVFSDPMAYQQQVENGNELVKEMWSLAVKGTTVTVNRPLLLTAVNAVSDSAAARKLSLGTHLPGAVLAFLLGIVLLGSMLIGMTVGGPGVRLWFDRVVAAAVLSLIVYAIMDMEYPRLGTKLLEKADAMLIDLRHSMD
jgi:hypothetical protein